MRPDMFSGKRFGLSRIGWRPFRPFQNCLFIVWVLSFSLMLFCNAEDVIRTAPNTKMDDNPLMPTPLVEPTFLQMILSPTPRIDLGKAVFTTLKSPGSIRLIHAFWSEEGARIFYAIAESEVVSPETLRWFMIDVSRNYVEEALSTPPRSISPYPFWLVTDYPYLGQVSPCGRYRLELESNLDEVGYFSQTPIVSSLWLIDKDGLRRKVFEGNDLFFRGAYWSLDEREAVLGVGPEFGTELYLLDVASATMESVGDFADFHDPNISEWLLSPNGEMVAVLGMDLFVLRLREGKTQVLPVGGTQLHWSRDSRVLFLMTEKWLVGYDLETGNIIPVLNLELLDRKGIPRYGGYDIAPDNSALIFWSWEIGGLWLVVPFAQ